MDGDESITSHEINDLSLRQGLFTSSTKRRVNELQQIQDKLERHGKCPSSAFGYLDLLADTFARGPF